MLRTEIIDEPGFAEQTDALLARFGPADELQDYETLLAARAEPADPDLAGPADPAVVSAELYLPLRGGPTLARLYRVPGAGPGPLLLWLHGGGFIGGTVGDIDAVCCGLAHQAGLTVVSLEYRLAPEHPFPAALHDTYDAMRWLAAHGGFLGGDGRLAAGGQSAGAALVAGRLPPGPRPRRPRPDRASGALLSGAGLRPGHRVGPALRRRVPQHQG